jgi:allantoin racemase
MRILIVNPNTTAAMTGKIGAAARAVAAPGTDIIAVNPTDGPVSIEGYYDEAFSAPGLLAEIAKGEAAGVSAHIIACFDDTALEAARSLALAPVIGIGEAAFHLASLVAYRFSVVTTLSRSIAAIETNLLKYGLHHRCAKVRACEVPVLALNDPASDAAAQIGAEIERAKREDRAEAVVLGCAGMADLAAHLTEQHGLPVIDGVSCAVKLAEACSAVGLRTSKIGAYAAPRPKPYSGAFVSSAPGQSEKH